MIKHIVIAGFNITAVCINSESWSVSTQYNPSLNDTTLVYEEADEERAIHVPGNLKVIGQFTFYAYQANTMFRDFIKESIDEIRKQLQVQLNGESYVLMIDRDVFVACMNEFTETQFFSNLTGVEEIAYERYEQINIHGYTPEFEDENSEFYNNKQLAQAAVYTLILNDKAWPDSWGKNEAIKIRKKDYLGRLSVAGALIAAEIDRVKRSMIIAATTKPEPEVVPEMDTDYVEDVPIAEEIPEERVSPTEELFEHDDDGITGVHHSDETSAINEEDQELLDEAKEDSYHQTDDLDLPDAE